MVASFVAKSLERQHLRTTRKYTLQLVDINMVLSNIHHQIAPHIDHSKYEAATSYVNQYVAHTDIWHLKFVSNLENPEVVLMQLFHLMHIIDNEPADSFVKERLIIEEQRLKFREITLYSDEHIEKRRQKLNAYIEAY